MNAPILRADNPAPRSTLRRSTSGLFVAVVMAAVAAFLPSAARAQLYTETSTLHGESSISSEAFGLTLAASGDTIVVGTSSAPPHGEYRAYVFARGASGWAVQQQMTFPTADVAIDGDTLVGGGAIYVRSGGTWTLQQTPMAPDHPRPALQGDTLVVGSPYDRTQDRGSVSVFTRSGSTWTQQAGFGPDGPARFFGDSVALDGDTLLASVEGPGGAYVYVRSGTTWTQQARLAIPTGTGWGMKVALEGNTAAVSDPANDHVYIFTRSGTTWTLAQTLTMPFAGGNDFGYKLSLKGGILGVGADTAFYLYSKTSSGWVQADLLLPPGYHGLEGGLALANRGKLFVVGNPSDNSAKGIVTIYSVPPPPPPGSGWKDADIGAVGRAGSSTGSGSTATVSGSGADIWGANDQFHFRTESLTGDGAIIARVDSAGSGNPWAKVGLMFREDVAPASRTVMALVTPGGHLGLQARLATADTTSFQDKWSGAPIWLMLARTGDHFDAFRSADGDNWTPLGSATVSMPPTIHVGLAVSSHDNAALNTGTFSGIELVGTEPPPPPPPPPPATLTGNDVGTVGVAGSFTDSNGTLTIDAAGADLWNQADSGYFVHREITGDFDIRAKVTSLTNTHPWAKAGIMVRESLAAGARNVFTLVTAGNAAGQQVRATASGTTSFTSGPWVNAPYWVRLVRTGNSFQSLISGDGATWQAVGTTTLALPATLRAGVAVSSHVANTATHATVTSLQFGN